MSIILKDSSLVPEKFTSRCRDIQKLVADGRCNLIELRNRMKKEDTPEIFKEYGANRDLYTGILVGVFEYRGEDGTVEQVVIGDRFGPDAVANDGANGEFLSPFAWEMLELCLSGTPLRLLNEYRTSGETDILDKILIHQLAAQLEQAWKKGRFRVYRTFSRYDYRVRGQLDLPRKIRLSMGLDDGKMAYRVREYSEDNIYNQLFFQACLEAEKRHPKWMRQLRQRMSGFHMAWQDLEQQSAGWGRLNTRSLLNGTRKKITNPIYRDYETLRFVARAVLARASHSSYPYADSGASFVTGIFLDISKLWEDYLYRAVFWGLPRRPRTQAREAILEEMLNIRPDFLWKKEKKEDNRVLDAKYRPIWGAVWNTPSREERIKVREAGKDPVGEHVRDDVYQVLSYMLALDCAHGGVIFPVSGKRPVKKEHPDRPPAPAYKAFQAVNGKTEWSFWLIPFFVPQSAQGKDGKSFRQCLITEARMVRGEVEKFLQP